MGRTIAMLGIVLLLLLLASGCEKELNPFPVASASSNPPAANRWLDPEAGKELQNGEEKQMVLMFAGLLQMDKVEGLALQAKQAERMLPVIRASVSKGMLDPADQDALIGWMTPEQSVFLSERSRRIRTPAGAPDDVPPVLTEEESRQTLSELERRRMVEQELRSNQNLQQLPGYDDLGKSVERQLIELLEERAASLNATEPK